MIYNRLPVEIGGDRRITLDPISYQYDVQQILMITGDGVPDYYTAEFCNDGDTTVMPMVGTAEGGVAIPNSLLRTGRNVIVYLVITGEGTAVETRYEITIPVNARPLRSDIEPTDDQQLQIDTLVAALNTGVGRAETAAGEAEAASQAIQDMDVDAETLAEGSAASVEKTVDPETGAVTLNFGIPKGDTGATGPQGQQGIQGETGPQGPQGIQGEKGDPFTYEDLTEEQKAELVQGPILDAQTAAVNAVGTTRVAAVNAVNQAGTTQTGNVNRAGTDQVAAVNAAGAAQVQAVEDKGDEVLDSIPADYSALTAEVDDLTRQISDVEDATEAALDTKAPVIINTASGAIASVDDGADSMPIRKLVAQIEPVQDLHGYSNPWPAGGGKNLLNVHDSVQTVNGVTATVKDGVATLSGTASSRAVIYFARGINIPAGSYKFNGSQSALPASCYLNFNSGTGVSVSESGSTLDVALNLDTDTSGDNSSYVRIDIAEGTNTNNLVFKPMIRLATETDATFAPYSNECPISGHTGAEIGQAGKNLIPNLKVQDTNTRVRLGESTVGNGFFLKAGTYKISFALVATQAVGIYWRIYKDGISGPVVNSDTVTIDEDCFIRVWLYASGGISADNVAWFQLEPGSTPTAYEPYTGNQISVMFPSEAGTVYGGTLTINPDRTGELVVDRAMVDLGTLTWAYYTSRQMFQSNLVGASDKWNGVICSNYKTIQSAYDQSDYTVGLTRWSFNNGQINVVDHSFNGDVTAFKTAMNGVIAVYELANPIEYQLTESEISGILGTLYGTNNIWADTGDVEVTYPADTKLFIEKLTQPTEDDMTSDHAISAGTFFMIGNTLYLATAQIAAGATITPGTNATKLSLADALNQLNT